MQAQRLADDDPGRKRREHSLHAENDGRMGRLGIFLRNGLDGVADPHGQRPTVENRERGVLDVAPADGLDTNRDAQANECTYRVLHHGEPQRVVALRRRSEHHELHGDRCRTEQFQPISIPEPQMLAAQVVETRRGAERAGHDAPAQALSDEQRQNRHDDDVHRADEARISHFGVGEPNLLRADGNCHRHAQQAPGRPRPALACRGRNARSGCGVSRQPVAQDRDHERTEQKAYAGKKERADRREAQALGHERATPDQCGQ